MMSRVQSNIGNDACSDELLLSRYFKDGDRDAMDEIFKRYAGIAFRVAFADAANAADAEEIVQMAFLKVLLSEVKEIENVRGWIMRIVVNTCHNKMKEEAQRRSRQKSAGAERAATETLDDERGELISAAVSAVNGLPRNYRMPVWLHFLEGLSFKDVASALALPEETVSRQASRGIEHVRQSLAAAGFTASAVAIPGLLASAHLAPAPVALTESFKLLIATKALGAGTGAAAISAAPAKGLAGLLGVKVAAGLVLAATAAFVTVKHHGGDLPTNPKEEVVPAPTPVKVAATTVAGADSEWPQWRGPARDGVVPGNAKVPDSWPKEGPKQLWKSEWIPGSPSGSGMGSPVVAEGKVFLYVTWRHPVGGGSEYCLITDELLRDFGWLPEMPDDLAAKIEAARVSPKRPKTDGTVSWYAFTRDQNTQVETFLKKHPEMEAYIKEFTATLDPKDAEKYDSYIKRRFCGRADYTKPYTLDELRKLAKFKDKTYRSESDCLADIAKQLPASNNSEQALYFQAWSRASTVTDTVICLDSATGKEIWKKEYPMAGGWSENLDHGIIYGAAGTPAVAGGKCFANGVMGLYCFSTKDGTLLWQDKCAGINSSMGVANGVVYGGSPLTAYNADTGKVLWRTNGTGSNASSPVLWSSGGKDYIITCGGGGQYCCVDFSTGKVLWNIRCGDAGHATPVISGDTLVLLTYMAGTQAYKITPEKAELLWKKPGGDNAISPVIYQDNVYIFNCWYCAPNWLCLDLKTGEKKWAQLSPIHADTVCSSPTLIDGKIIYPIGDGHSCAGYQIGMLKATPEKYTPLGLFNPESCPLASPAITGGKMVLRLRDGVACYDLRQ
jgi:RNA polymerase sigma-70 factor (ECF subfamily)